MEDMETINEGDPSFLHKNLPRENLTAEQVYHDYAPRVYNMARRMLSNDLDAEDVTQDVLLQVVRKLPTFRGESAFPTWLHRVTVNAALAHRRKRAAYQDRYVRNPLDDLLEAGQRPGTDRPWVSRPEEQLLSQELQQLIEQAIEELPDIYREVFVLSDIEGLPNGEIAEMLDLSLPAMKSRLHRARLCLRNALAPYFEEIAV